MLTIELAASIGRWIAGAGIILAVLGAFLYLRPLSITRKDIRAWEESEEPGSNFWVDRKEAIQRASLIILAVAAVLFSVGGLLVFLQGGIWWSMAPPRR